MFGSKAKDRVKQLIAFFSTPSRPVSQPEFDNFWNSCTAEQKIYFTTVPLN